jgi:hypothetical protein
VRYPVSALLRVECVVELCLTLVQRLLRLSHVRAEGERRLVEVQAQRFS